jgi:hypothetical protein
MPAKGGILFNSSLISAANTPDFVWDGGRTCLVINALSYGGTLGLQLKGPSGAYINLGSALTTDSVVAFDAPAGDYRLTQASGSSVAVVATLVSTPYV